MNSDWITANLPWTGLLIAAFVVARILVWSSNAKLKWKRIPAIHKCEEGSTQSLSFVLTLPFFMMILMLIVQVCQIMMANIAVHQAAYASVRSAAVWIPATIELETANRISSFSLLEQTAEGTHFRIQSNVDSPKYSKIKQAAVLAVASHAPSRDFEYQLDAQGLQTANALARLYGGLDADSNSNRSIATRLRNKLAYANANTVVQVDFWHRVGPFDDFQDPPLQQRYDVPPYRDEYAPNELGWQDHITSTVTFNVPLLPGPLRFLKFNSRNQISVDSNGSGTATHSRAIAAKQQQTCEDDEEQDPTETDSGGNCPVVPADDGCGTTDATGQTFTFSVSASATMIIEGQKALLTYVQEGF